MNFINKLERKFGRFAIPNLSMYLIALYAVGAVISLMDSSFYWNYLSLNPFAVLHGQPWRIVTFLLATPSTNIIFLIFVLYFYYAICRSLEQAWGAFRFNLYIFTGIIGTVIAAFLVYFITRSPYIFMGIYYINLSLFLAYAACFPDLQVLLYMIIPIKVKWLAYADVALLVWEFIQGDIGSRVAIIVALLNFLIFFFGTRNYNKISPKQVKRRRTYIKEVKKTAKTTRHECAVCHRTEKDDPNLEFRFCSRCDGNYEYCQDHLFSHAHVKKR